MAEGLQSACLYPAILYQVSRSPRTSTPASLSPPSAHVHHQWPMWMHQHSLVSDSAHGLLFRKQLLETTQVQLQSSCLLSSGSCSNNLKFNSPKQRTPNLEPPLLVYCVPSQAGIPPILPRQWQRNYNFKAGPDSCSPYKKLKAKPSMSQSTALPPSDSAISVRNLKIHILALPSTLQLSAKQRSLLLRGHILFGEMLVIPITRGLSSPARKCLLPWLQEPLSTDRTLCSVCRLAQHGSIPPLGQWCWIQGRRARCESHAEMLCIGWKLLSLFFYCHLISFPPFSEVQRRSLLHTREADKVLKVFQTFLHPLLRPGSVRKTSA